MKRIVCLSLILALVITMAACNGTQTDSSTDSTDNALDNKEETVGVANDAADSYPTGTAHIHSFLEATCSAPATCSCGATDKSIPGHNYNENGICVRCGHELNK